MNEKKKIDGLNCVLLIDDDEDDNFISKRIIERMLDVQVRSVEDGREALDYLTRQGRYANTEHAPKPDLVLLDINMHRMNGWEFLEQYENLPAEIKQGVVVRMLTTSYNPDDADRARKYSDVSGFLHKPLTSYKMGNVLEMHFEKKKQRA